MTELFVLSPIVGEVTSSSAVVLFVTSHTVQLKLVVKRDYIIQAAALQPTRIFIADLKPNQLYSLRIFYQNENVHIQRISTYAPRHLAIVSCDYPELDTANSLWHSLSDHQIDLTLHLGDNVYADEVYWRAQNLLEESSLIEAQPIIASEYAARYHYTWNRWAPLLRDSSHLIIPDDHEIVDNFTESNAVTEIALNTIDKYEHALWRFFPIERYGSSYWVGHTLIYMCTRIYTKDGPVNSEILTDILRQASEAQTLILCLSTAPLFNLEGWAGWIVRKAYSENLVWTDAKLLLLYKALFEWLATNSERKAIIIAGDLHIGVKGEVSNGAHTIPIYVTSPISYHPTPLLGDFFAKHLQGKHHLKDYTMHITEAYSKRNYLLFDLETHQADLKVSSEHTPGSLWEMWQNILSLTEYTAGVAGQ